MCGFFGEFTDSLSDEKGFLGILNLSVKRGPDQQGTWTNGVNCRMGFNRLAIIDTSERGRQPLISPSGRYAIVYNGEIYNYRALKKKYGIPDSRIRSTSDSEILAHLFDETGIENTARELNGMFAIAVYDGKTNSLSLMRDYAGIKPLFYGTSEEGVVFASQFDQVFTHPAIRNNMQIDPEGLYDYLALGYMCPPRTVFTNIRQCEPGELITIDGIHKRTHAIFRRFDTLVHGTVPEESADAAGELDALLGEVVSDQLVSDVPVGLFLSGGIDSPLIAAYAGQNKPDITAYTIGLSDSNLDESVKAGEYAKALGLKHEVISFGKEEMLEINDRHFETLTEPFGDYSSLPTYMVTRISRERNTVMLSGDGGDELFWGYPRFLKAVNQMDRFRMPFFLRRYAAGIQRMMGKKVSFASSDYRTMHDWILGRQSYNNARVLHEVLPGIRFSEDVLRYYTPPGKIDSEPDMLQWMRWNEFYGHMQRVLAKVDRTSMGSSLEVRVPFLDLRMIEFAWKLDGGLGIRHQTPKLLLRNALQRKLGDVPVSGRKKGFSFPLKKMMLDGLREDVRMHLFDKPLFGSDYISTPGWNQCVNRFFNEGQGNEWGIWIMYALQKWASRYGLAQSN